MCGGNLALLRHAMTIYSTATVKRKAVWGPKRTLAAVFALLITLAATTFAAPAREHVRKAPKARDGRPNAQAKSYRLDNELTKRATRGTPNGVSSVIVTLVPGATLPPEFKKFARRAKLDLINGQVLELPNRELRKLAAHPNIFRVHENRPIGAHNYRTSVTVGATAARYYLGLTGRGIGVAVIDSGIATWHDDLTSRSSTLYP